MKKIVIIAVLFMALFSCKRENKNTEEFTVSQDSVQQIDAEQLRIDSLEMIRKDSLVQVRKDSLLQVKQDSLQKIVAQKRKQKKYEVFKGEEFSYWPIKVSDSLRKLFHSTFTKEQQYTIAALNRIDTDHINGRDTLIVPNEFKSSFMDYAPFPRKMEFLDQVSKIVIFSYPIQAFGVYEKGNLVKWGPTNMGKQSAQTPRGLFFTNWKGRRVISSVDDEWILNWNFNISNQGGVGWHQYGLPGYPASHSCLRLLDADAQWLYNWADQWVLEDEQTIKVKGTPVVVYGDYKFGVIGIWHQLVLDPQATTLSKTDLEKVVTPYVTEILNQQTIRETYNKSKEITNVQTDSLKVAKDTLDLD